MNLLFFFNIQNQIQLIFYSYIYKKNGYLFYRIKQVKQIKIKILLKNYNFFQNRSGKTSIIKTLTTKCQPNQSAQQYEQTLKIEKSEMKIASNQINIYDFYGGFNIKQAIEQELEILKNCKSIVYVIDGQQEQFDDAIIYFDNFFQIQDQINKNCNYHYFIHKIDNDGFVRQDQKQCKQNIYQFNQIKLLQKLCKLLKLSQINYHDQSLSEAFSKVIHKIIPQFTYITQLLTNLTSKSKMEKAFLFDQVNKLYIATDSGPFDQNTYQLCYEMIDVYLDISCIYDPKENNTIESSEGCLQIKLSDSNVLLMKSFKDHLALICIIKQENYQRPYIIDYNIDIFYKGNFFGFIQLLYISNFFLLGLVEMFEYTNKNK
ncbi:Ras-related GTP binding C, putative [Ichthyophthirius multifiliis]|uniref:Ras-related GTP binding C, putative n=1 Tax=Ichthyophthirius multifiliis TaxID=5932 RepID=G0QME6_ICHMU|nr:Ras-related GTP binding C, putative [Ichthyophthirius multifiliis]EGR33615.1 Ras-related GTP binding C, putative [Ichthyophthirius multifiliis]|eukprot:XP_004037601.1 Ras-related GTP binding C, putative [Ichthyophthirius multifiliis]